MCARPHAHAHACRTKPQASRVKYDDRDARWPKSQILPRDWPTFLRNSNAEFGQPISETMISKRNHVASRQPQQQRGCQAGESQTGRGLTRPFWSSRGADGRSSGCHGRCPSGAGVSAPPLGEVRVRFMRFMSSRLPAANPHCAAPTRQLSSSAVLGHTRRRGAPEYCGTHSCTRDGSARSMNRKNESYSGVEIATAGGPMTELDQEPYDSRRWPM